METGNAWITPRLIRVWADEIGTGDPVLAELDLRLVLLLRAIGRSPIHERLSFKGGTALNKMYFSNAARLSVDLDFNAIGSEDVVFRSARALRAGLIAIGETEGLRLRRHQRDAMGDYFLFGYASTIDEIERTIKVEISIVERFSVLGYERRPLAVPWHLVPSDDSPCLLQTEPLIELLATKVRALHQRRKGRDLFDLFQAVPVVDNKPALRKLVLFYFACRRVPFNHHLFFQTLDQKLNDRRFRDDLFPFLRQGSGFSWDDASGKVRDWLAEVLVLDEHDSQFVLLVKNLLGIADGQDARAARHAIELPLVYLFTDHVDLLANDAQALTTDQFKMLLEQNRRT